MSGHTALISCSLETTAPRFSTSTTKTSSVFGGSDTRSLDRNSNLPAQSRRNGPNAYKRPAYIEMRGLPNSFKKNSYFVQDQEVTVRVFCHFFVRAVQKTQHVGGEMEKVFRSFITICLGLTVMCESGRAQAIAQISGTVSDQTGAVLPGVEVTATQTETGISRAAVTNEAGS